MELKTREKENNMQSPFVFRKNMELRCDNRGKELSQGAYLKLEKKEVINSYDRTVIMNLLNMGYATRRTLNIAIREDKDCKKSLDKLVRNNVINKYHYVYDNNGTSAETVCFYHLSGAAKKVSVIGFRNAVTEGVNRIIKSESYNSDDVISAPVKILKMLELNNFNASFCMDYEDKIEKKYDGYVFKDGKISYKQQYMYKLQRKDNEE